MARLAIAALIWALGVWNLAAPGAVGPQGSPTYKVPGVDTLPAGATYANGRVNITGDGVTLDGWDFRGAKYITVSGNVSTVRNSLFDFVGGEQGGIDIGFGNPVSGAVVEFNSFDGLKATGSKANAINVRDLSTGVRIRRNRIQGMQQDSITLNGEAIVEENNITVGGYGGPTVHSDAITLQRGDGIIIRRNLIDVTPETGTYGVNNHIRIQPLGGNAVTGAMIYRNIFIGRSTLTTYAIEAKDATGTISGLQVFDNIWDLNANGLWAYPTSPGVVRSSGNRLLSDGSLLAEMPGVNTPQPAQRLINSGSAN